MLDNINPDSVCAIITLAREFHAKEDVIIDEPSENPSGDWARHQLEDYDGDPIFGELKNAINDLEPDQQMTLVALMWLGRGDFEKNEWELAQRQARGAYTAHTAEYLIATPLVADYLLEGLAMHGYACEQ